MISFTKYVIFTFLILSSIAYSNIYVGAGFSYLLPTSVMQDYNQDGIGLKLELSNKTYCKLWYGVRLDYLSLNKANDPIRYYDRAISLNTFLKYAPFTDDCYDNKVIPYLQGMIGFSSITPNETFTNNGSNLALGGGLGLGLAYNFKLFKKCWMIEIDGLFYAPNSIERAKQRDNLQSFTVGLTLSMSL